MKKEPVNKLTYEEVYNTFEKYGYELLDKEYKNAKSKMSFCQIETGYKFFSDITSFKRANSSAPFSPRNKYTIYNIQKFLDNNDINIKILSSKYKKSDEKLIFECYCGNKFERRWAAISQKRGCKCDVCLSKELGQRNRKIDYKKTVEEDTDGEYNLIKEFHKISESGIKELFLTVKHNTCGREYDVLAASFKKGCRCQKCYQKYKAGKSKMISLKDFIFNVYNDTMGEYDCVEKDNKERLIGFYDDVTIKHNICGNIYKTKSGYFKNGLRCPRCNSLKNASYLHIFLSLLFERFYDGVKNEYDIGFRGDNGGVSCYDLFVPNYKGKNTLFEFQSQYHDNKKEFDKRKRDFAISKGYEVIQIDHRDVKLVDVIKEYFPQLKTIPSDLDIKRFYKIDVSQAQEMLNKNMKVKEISDVLCVKEHIIRNAISNGVLVFPDTYKEVNSQKRKVVQLNLNGDFIAEYESIAEASRKTGFKSISKVVRGLLTNSGGYFWIYKEKYCKGDYKIPNIKDCQIVEKDFYMINENKEIIREYTSIKKATEETGIKSITYALSKNNHYLGGYFWVKKSEYEQIKNTLQVPKKRTNVAILQLDLNKNIIKEWESQTLAGKTLKYDIPKINKALKTGIVYKDCFWEYKEEIKEA